MQSAEGAPPTCWRLDQVNVTPQSVGSVFLKQIFEHLRSQDLDPTELVFTVPVQSYERYLQWLESCVVANGLSELEHIRIIDEPTAAALGYAIATPGSLILVVDFGGGTLDLCLVRTPRAANLNDWGDLLGELAPKPKKDHQVEVIAKTGQSLGGTDIDRWLSQDYSQRRNLSPATTRLLLPLMEKIKVALSVDEIAHQVFFDQGTGYDISYTRHQLEQILKSQGFYAVLQTAIDEVVNEAVSKGILKMDLKHVVLIGGSSLIPSVRALIANSFPHAHIYDDQPFDAVVKGALILNHGLGIRDYLYHSYAIRYWQSSQWQYQPLFLKGQSYPTRQPYTLILRASQINQTKIDLVIGELDQRSINSVEVIFEGDRLITKIGSAVTENFLPLADTPQAIATLDPPGQPDCDRLKVLFSISDRRQLLITVIDLATQVELLTNQVVAELR
jgi:molecular chaperone DnaK (HSP70)